MQKGKRCVKKLGKIKFPKGIDLTHLDRQPRLSGSKGMSISDVYVDEWFVLEDGTLALYKTYDNLSIDASSAKQIKNIRMYNELLCAKLCDILGVGHAIYERAHIDNTNGLITHSILDEHEAMAPIIGNTSMLGDFVELLREKEKLKSDQIREIVQVLYTYMLFDLRTLQTDRNRNNAPLVRNNVTGELRVGELIDCEYAYLTNNMIRLQKGGDDFFKVYDRKNPVDAEAIIEAYDTKMGFGSYYSLNVYKCLEHRTLENRIEEVCSLAAMSPELGEIFDDFMASFDLRRAIKELEDEKVIPSKGYVVYILAIDDYVKQRMEYHRSISLEEAKKYTESKPAEYTSLYDRFEIMHMLDMARSGSRTVASQVLDNYDIYYRNVKHHGPLH